MSLDKENTQEKSTSQESEKSFRAFRERYLFNPWGLSPEHSKRQFSSIQYFDKKLEGLSWYQGLSVLGSTMYGYGHDGSHSSAESAEREPSDIDIIPIIDSGDSTYSHEAARKLYKELKDDVRIRFGIDVHILGQVDASYIHGTPGPQGVLAHDIHMNAFAALSVWTTQRGTRRHPGKVGKFVQLYKHFCATLSPQVRGTLKRNLIDRLSSWEPYQEQEIERRIPEYGKVSYAEKSRMTYARRELWRRRVETLFGL